MGKPKYSGILNWAGSTPKFPATGSVNGMSNLQYNLVYNYYLARLTSIAISVFKWEGLPKGINENAMEWWLYRYGKVLFVHDEGIAQDPMQRSPEGYAVMKVALGNTMDIYNLPEVRYAYTANADHSFAKFTAEDSVVVFDNVLGYPMDAGMRMYAEQLTNIDMAMYVNTFQQKTPRIIKCNEKQRLSLKNLFQQVDGFEVAIWADKDLDLSGVEVLDTVAPYVSDKMETLKHQVWNDALTFAGVENTNTDKKERLISDEVTSNMGDVEASRFTRLNMRLQASEWIQETFGIEIVPSFRSGTYIKAEGTEGNIEVDGMQQGSVDGYVGAGDDSLWTKLKKALKGGTNE